MPLRKLASSEAYSLLAELISLGMMPPTVPGGITSVARSEEHHVQVIVTIADYTPATISAETLARIDAMNSVPENPDAFARLRPAQRAIAELLRRDRPAKCEWLAMKLGKKNGGSFRSLCTDLERAGVARHIKGVGYFLI